VSYNVELSPREKQIAGLVCEGLTNKEIAKITLTNSVTIKNQLYSAFTKSGCRNRVEFVIYCFKKGIAKLPEEEK
jgi:DNA-binding NarL/FixJ family response regulator